MGPLVARLERVLPDLPVEVIFVDDSDDDTPDAIRSIDSSRAVYLIHRRPADRAGGLGGAVVEGIRAARAPFVCVMDADLQHPPELLEEMYSEAMETGSDLVVGSRFCRGGDKGTFSRMRTALSRLSTRAAMLLFPTRLWHVSDPMSGCFIVRREAVDLDCLRPRGFKILLEILVRTPGLRVSEVPLGFGERNAGHTKASVREALRYLGQLGRLELGQLSARFGRFTVVGATGLVVNTLLLALFAEVIGIFYVLAAILATQGSTLWNFCLTEAWVFAGRDHKLSGGRRAAMFFAMNNAALALRVPLLVVLTSGLGINLLVANVLSLVALTLVRFGVADVWIWAKAQRREVESYSYDIHGLVTVTSEVRLPELERFLTPEAFGRANIRVRIGQIQKPAEANGVVAHNGNGGPPQNGNRPPGNGNGNGNGHSLNGQGPRRALLRPGASAPVAQHPVHRGPRGVRLRGRDLAGGGAHRGDRLAAAGALAARSLHERGGADPAVDLRGQGLRARARGVLRGRRPRRHAHGPHRHRQDDHGAEAARPLPVFVPVGRPHDRVPRRARAGVSEAAHDQPAHRRGGADTAAVTDVSGSS